MHAFVKDLERPVGTYLYGRRMYETMVYWETDDDDDPVARDFGEVWRAAEKVVYSRTLQAVSSERTRLERDFDEAAITRQKESSSTDITIGGAELAGQANRGGVGGRMPSSPRAGPRRRRQARPPGWRAR